MNRTMCKLSLAVVAVFMLFGCLAPKNQYMIKDTAEYRGVTQKIDGNWRITSYTTPTGKNLLSSPYDEAVVAFNFAAGTARFAFTVSEAYLSARMGDWKAQFPDLTVDEYKVEITDEWEIESEGNVLDTNPHNKGDVHNIVITGSGANFDGFYGWERTKFEAGKNTGSGGGLLGIAMGMMAQKATGTSDLFIGLADNYTFDFSPDGRTLNLCRKGAVYRADTTDCSERLVLERMK